MLSIFRERDTVVVSRFFRLGRSRDHHINLVGSFAKGGIVFKALDLGIDSSTPAGKMIIGIFASLAEYDREMILEKTRAGQILVKAKGKHVGRPAGVKKRSMQCIKKGAYLLLQLRPKVLNKKWGDSFRKMHPDFRL